MQNIILALKEAYSLILDEYATVQDGELKKRYAQVVEKLNDAIK